jgi:hypothetical protein
LQHLIIDKIGQKQTRQPKDGGTHIIDFQGFLWRHQLDEHTTVGDDFHKDLGLQAARGLTQGATRNTEPGGQLNLMQALTRPQLTGHDQAFQTGLERSGQGL